MRAYLSRRYSLSAAHRLHAESLSAQENQAVFGKCNNPHGHGHNYSVEVTYAGAVDAVTGMVVNLEELDAYARERVLDRFDLANLNVLQEFADVVPTTENFARVLHGIFAEFTQAELVGVRVEETSNNSFEYLGEATWLPV